MTEEEAAEIRAIAREEARAAVASFAGAALARSSNLTIGQISHADDALKVVFGHALEQFSVEPDAPEALPHVEPEADPEKGD